MAENQQKETDMQYAYLEYKSTDGELVTVVWEDLGQGSNSHPEITTEETVTVVKFRPNTVVYKLNGTTIFDEKTPDETKRVPDMGTHGPTLRFGNKAMRYLSPITREAHQ